MITIAAGIVLAIVALYTLPFVIGFCVGLIWLCAALPAVLIGYPLNYIQRRLKS